MLSKAAKLVTITQQQVVTFNGTIKVNPESILINMHLQIHFLLSMLLQVSGSASTLTSRQEEGIGNLLAIAVLAFFVAVLIFIGFRLKAKKQKEEN